MLQERKLEDGVGLALSGGGFRATLFHTGSLWRLNELGLLKKINRICSVSGGSITAGVLGHRWNRLQFDNKGVAVNFSDVIVKPLQEFCSLNVDVTAGIAGIISIFKRISDMVIAKYDENLFNHATLQDLPSDGEGPRFIFYATSLQTGTSVRLSKAYMADYRIGRIDSPTVSLATAVAASSAFPPFLSPVILTPNSIEWKPMEGTDLYNNEQLRSRMVLTDGGVYDNLGLEAIWKRYKTVLVSDAGAPMDLQVEPSLWWHNQLLRALGIITEQTRALRKRSVIEDYVNKSHSGTYWGIKTEINNYQLADALVKDNDLTKSFQSVRTRLNSFLDEEQGHLINWGYALADAALRKHVYQQALKPKGWPLPSYPL